MLVKLFGYKFLLSMGIVCICLLDFKIDGVACLVLRCTNDVNLHKKKISKKMM